MPMNGPPKKRFDEISIPPIPPPIPSQRYNPKSLAQIEAEIIAVKSELDFVTAAVVGFAVGSILSEGCDADSST